MGVRAGLGGRVSSSQSDQMDKCSMCAQYTQPERDDWMYVDAYNGIVHPKRKILPFTHSLFYCKHV